jgi:hypothetical protein
MSLTRTRIVAVILMLEAALKGKAGAVSRIPALQYLSKVFRRAGVPARHP